MTNRPFASRNTVRQPSFGAPALAPLALDLHCRCDHGPCGLRRGERRQQRCAPAPAQRCRGARRKDLQRHRPFRLRTDVLRDVPCASVRACRAAGCTDRPIGWDQSRRARISLSAVAALPLPDPRVFLRQRRHADGRLRPRRARELAHRTSPASVPGGARNGECDRRGRRGEGQDGALCRRIPPRLRRWNSRCAGRRFRSHAVRAFAVPEGGHGIPPVRQQIRPVPRRQGRALPAASSRDSRSTTIRPRAIAPPVIQAPAARMAHRRCLPISLTTIWASRATLPSPPTAISAISTWVCAGRSGRTSLRAPTSVVPSRSPRCATSRCAITSSTTAGSRP